MDALAFVQSVVYTRISDLSVIRTKVVGEAPKATVDVVMEDTAVASTSKMDDVTGGVDEKVPAAENVAMGDVKAAASTSTSGSGMSLEAKRLERGKQLGKRTSFQHSAHVCWCLF